MQGRIWTVPNQITFLRLGFLPVFLILISEERYKWALLVLVIAGFSDGIDGLIARKFNQRSSLGAYLDPIADKLLLSSSFIILAFKTKLAWWLTILILSRDLLILTVAVAIILVYGYRPFPPSI
jgi:cardiolipin synthase